MNLPRKINLAASFAGIDQPWSPRIGGEINDCQIKLAKLEGAFVWHHHENEDELFLVVSGHLRMEFRAGQVELAPGEYLIVPRGVEHRPVALPACEVVLIEPHTTRNTGNVQNEQTIEQLEELKP